MPGNVSAATQGATGAGGGDKVAAGAGGGGGGGGGGKGAAGPQLGVPRSGYGGGGMGGSGQGRTVLTMEDLGMAVGEYGVNVRRGEFYR
jgi:transcription initiation factor TFIID subunit 10